MSSLFSGKKTKIVATIGPKSGDEETLRQMIRAGMNVARINFSHGTHEDHATRIERVRRVAEEENTVVAILSDIQGPVSYTHLLGANRRFKQTSGMAFCCQGQFHSAAGHLPGYMTIRNLEARCS